MQVAQISASAAVSVTDTKIQLFLYESKLNRWQCAFKKNTARAAKAALFRMPLPLRD